MAWLYPRHTKRLPEAGGGAVPGPLGNMDVATRLHRRIYAVSRDRTRAGLRRGRTGAGRLPWIQPRLLLTLLNSGQSTPTP